MSRHFLHPLPHNRGRSVSRLERLITQLAHIFKAITRPIHHVFITATAVVDTPVNSTFIVLRYTDDTDDKVFYFQGLLEGEALHSRLDALIDEHYEDTLSHRIYVLTYGPSGDCDEEEVNFEFA